jgi:hypothetical protein
LKNGILLFGLVHQRWVLFATQTHGSWLFIATYWVVTNWSSLETCLHSFLGWANIWADLNNLTQMLTLAILFETYVGWSS